MHLEAPMPFRHAAKRQLELPLIQPIIPVERPTAWNEPNWLFEPKHDSFPGLVTSPRKDARSARSVGRQEQRGSGASKCPSAHLSLPSAPLPIYPISCRRNRVMRRRTDPS